MKLLALFLAALTAAFAGAPPDADKGKLMGQATAPISIEVFSSFACSHCKDFHEHVLPLLKKEFIDTGKVCLLPRETFPPNFTAALEAANTATAAARIGKYHEVADALFRQQLVWSQNGKVWDAVAAALTPDQQKKVQALVRDAAVTGSVQHDQQVARTEQVTTTPTLIIRSGARRYPVVGNQEYSLLRGLLNSILITK
jgi:protein-disulfide isomerase